MGLSRPRLAAQLGLSPNTIERYEAELPRPLADRIVQLAQEQGFSAAVLDFESSIGKSVAQPTETGTVDGTPGDAAESIIGHSPRAGNPDWLLAYVKDGRYRKWHKRLAYVLDRDLEVYTSAIKSNLEAFAKATQFELSEGFDLDGEHYPVRSAKGSNRRGSGGTPDKSG
jgi:transcriptional regulator with XRE-family HTH domain